MKLIKIDDYLELDKPIYETLYNNIKLNENS